MHGAVSRYEHAFVGGNFRLDALQAAVLDVKLPHLDDWHQKRRANAAYYDGAFAELPIEAPVVVNRGDGVEHAHIYNQYVIRIADRDRVRDELREQGVGCEVYYPVPMHLQECFQYLGYSEGDFPESERASRETLALPIYPELTEEMLETVVERLRAAVGAGV